MQAHFIRGHYSGAIEIEVIMYKRNLQREFLNPIRDALNIARVRPNAVLGSANMLP